MIELVRLATFLAFLGLGVRVALARDAQARRRRTTWLLAYVLGLSAAVALTQRDDWPFSTYNIASGRREDRPYSRVEIRALDADGGERVLSPLTWSPLSPLTLGTWLDRTFRSLTDEQQRRALAFLLDRAESARERRLRGERVGARRLLGPLAAPDWWLLDAEPDAPAATPHAGLRAYRVTWVPKERAVDPRRENRVLLGEYRRP